MDHLQDELEGHEDIAESFYDEALGHINSLRDKVKCWEECAERDGISELSARCVRGDLDMAVLFSSIRRDLKNFKCTNKMILNKDTRKKNEEAQKKLSDDFSSLVKKHAGLISRAKHYQTKRLKALQRFQAKRLDEKNMIELTEMGNAVINDSSSKGSEMASAMFSTAKAAEMSMINTLFGKTIKSKATTQDVEQIELLAGWRCTWKDLQFYTLHFSDPFRERGYKELSNIESVGRTRQLLLLSLVCCAGYITMELVYPWEGEGEYDVPILCLVSGTFLLFLLLFLAACLKSSHRFIKYISCFMFSYLVCLFSAFKILRNQIGPLFMMNIVFVILFTSSKMRFHVAAIVGFTGIIAFATTTYIALPSIDETSEGLQQQLVNFIVIFGSGVYESWLEERFSRLNYLISMDRRVKKRPEYSVDSSDPVENHISLKFDWRMDTSKTEEKKKRMEKHGMHSLSLSFKKSEMERKFMAGWYILDDHPFSDFEIPKFHLYGCKDVAIGSASMIFGQFMIASNQDTKTFVKNESDRNMVWILRGSMCGVYFLTLLLFFIVCRKIPTQVKLHEASSNDPYPFTYVRVFQIVYCVIAMIQLGVISVIMTFILPDDTRDEVTDLYFVGMMNLHLVYHSTSFKLRHVHADLVSVLMIVTFGVLVSIDGLPSDPTKTSHQNRYKEIEYVLCLVLLMAVSHYKSTTQEMFRRELFALKCDLMEVNDANSKLADVVRSFISRKRLNKQLTAWKKKAQGNLQLGSVVSRKSSGNSPASVRPTTTSHSSPVLYSNILNKRVRINSDADEDTKVSSPSSTSDDVSTKQHQIVDVWGDGMGDEDDE